MALICSLFISTHSLMRKRFCTSITLAYCIYLDLFGLPRTCRSMRFNLVCKSCIQPEIQCMPILTGWHVTGWHVPTRCTHAYTDTSTNLFTRTVSVLNSEMGTAGRGTVNWAEGARSGEERVGEDRRMAKEGRPIAAGGGGSWDGGGESRPTGSATQALLRYYSAVGSTGMYTCLFSCLRQSGVSVSLVIRWMFTCRRDCDVDTLLMSLEMSLPVHTQTSS